MISQPLNVLWRPNPFSRLLDLSARGFEESADPTKIDQSNNVPSQHQLMYNRSCQATVAYNLFVMGKNLVESLKAMRISMFSPLLPVEV